MPDRKEDVPEQTAYTPHPPDANAYCARMDLPVPRVESVAANTNANLYQLMVVSLLERGEPLSLDAIAKGDGFKLS
jgi:hypothetical protein